MLNRCRQKSSIELRIPACERLKLCPKAETGVIAITCRALTPYP